ncbi:MAG: ChbG/HpnK family deacetylase [Bryobacterales bacterium]|nr:ChbG/HpnK family deacetylase [Bryobacteraceae bacterium]MDW8129651.1 ChbG/HpnK family deacetylase [Bryobacterales bacterium]
MPPGERRLVVVADDFGFTRDVNQGILEAHTRGIVRAASLLATGAAFRDAVELARPQPALEIGAHLALVGLPSALDGQPLPTTVAALLRALARRRVSVYDEMAAQLESILAAGMRPVYLDTHKHTHVIPHVLDALLRLAEEHGIRWIRRPFDWRWKGEPMLPLRNRLARAWLGLLRSSFDRRLARSHCRSTDRFTGLGLTGRLDADVLVRLIRALPEGTTELMCHPGRCGAELRAAKTRLKESRARELQALTAPEVFAALHDSGVTVCGWRDLPAAGDRSRPRSRSR